jgi:hypothetical protein
LASLIGVALIVFQQVSSSAFLADPVNLINTAFNNTMAGLLVYADIVEGLAFRALVIQVV